VNVAFFGGSFNPPHVGHVMAACYARSLGFDQVVAAVVKSHAFPKQLEAFEHRAKMAELAFAPVLGVEVSRIEATLPTPSYTLHTLEQLQKLHPDWRMRLLVGSDVLVDVEQWHAFDEVKKLAPLFVLGRGGHERRGQPTLLPQISSTEVRRRLAAYAARSPDSADSEWLQARIPKPVLGYIRTHRLYSGQTS
jgi:nicotinate-nucleotide adenylyltransferase